MWHAVRRVAKRKPVIVSIGDLCASGGYYVASAGTKIFADDESVVGSIGVVGGKIVGEELKQRLGVNSERIARGKRAGWASSLSAFSDDERVAITGLLEDTYARFLDRIAEGRNLPKERIMPLAEGRIMSGKRAREGQLVDERGGLVEALAMARSMGKLGAEAPLEVWPPQRSLLDQIAQLASGPSAQAQVRAALPSLLPRALTQGLPLALVASGDLQLAVLPFSLSVR
jgi:protease-4